jgi:pyrroloquinoline quinone biosynthesis protein B
MQTSKILLLFFIAVSCSSPRTNEVIIGDEHNLQVAKGVSLIILGTIQDAGSPHIACKKDCCKNLFDSPDKKRKVVSLGVVDTENNKK